MNSYYAEFSNIEAFVKFGEGLKFKQEIRNVGVGMREIVIKQMNLFMWLASLDIQQYRIVEYIESVVEECKARNCEGWGEEIGALVNEKCQKLMLNALQVAVSGGKIKVAKIMLEFGGNTGVIDRFGRNLVHLAAGADCSYLVYLLVVKYNVNCDHVDAEGKSPLHVAVMKPCKNAAILLMKLTKNINCIDSKGNGALDYAVFKKNYWLVKNFIANKAKVKKETLALKEFQDVDKRIKSVIVKNIQKEGIDKRRIKKYALCLLMILEPTVYIFDNNCKVEFNLTCSLIITFALLYALNIILLILLTIKKLETTKTSQQQSLLDLLEKFKPEFVCIYCQSHFKETTRHCFICNTCIKEYDHHCKWLNKCIGKGNICIFNIFLFTFTIFLLLRIVIFIFNHVVTNNWNDFTDPDSPADYAEFVLCLISLLSSCFCLYLIVFRIKSYIRKFKSKQKFQGIHTFSKEMDTQELLIIDSKDESSSINNL